MIKRLLAVFFALQLVTLVSQAQTANQWASFTASGGIIGTNSYGEQYYGAATGSVVDPILNNTVTLTLSGEVVAPYSCLGATSCSRWALTTGYPTNYTSSPYVTVAPSTSTNLIAATGGGVGSYAYHTLTFSRPVSNVVMSFYSLGTPSQLSAYTFTQPFTILQTSACTAGSYCLYASNNNLTVNGKEGAGTILFKGTYSSISWTVSVPEDFSGFDFGISGVAFNFGPTTADTQQSLVNTVQPLQSTFTMLNTALANSLTYDCQVFDKNNICISAGGRNTAVSAADGLNNTSALLIAAYRPHPNYRIGAYADQNLSVNNAGSTVNLGNNTPLVGLFGAWNERLDGTGTEIKVSAAYGQKNTTITRQVVGTSEAGSGGAPINSQGAQVAAKYGFAVAENTIVSPYVGVRYTQNNMGGYTEAASSTVTAPLTYSALNTNATTALAGVGAQYKFIPQATAFASVGVETDTNTSNGTYSATGVAGLTPINFNSNPVKTRPTATVGAYYDVERNQRLGITGIYRQEPYQAVQTTTVMATYTVGL